LVCQLELISYNDDYEPEEAIAKTNKLIEEDKVFALIGEVGTPTSKAVRPIATEQGVPFIAPFTGADFLRDPSLTNVINVRASYGQETEASTCKPSSRDGRDDRHAFTRNNFAPESASAASGSRPHGSGHVDGMPTRGYP
jgi:hypothetical protein